MWKSGKKRRGNIADRKIWGGSDVNATTLTVVLFVCGGLIACWLIATYNGMLHLQGQAQRAWANVDVVLKERADLIPSLVSTIKGYAAHERETLERVSALRAQAVSSSGDRTTRLEAEREIGRLLPRLLAVVERYPDLRASGHFLHLQQELVRLEEVIADRREVYNEATTNHNIFRRTFPASLVAGSVTAEDLPLFQALGTDRAVPAVTF